MIPQDTLLKEIEGQTAFHRTWQLICMLGYVLPAIAGTIAATVAAVVAALGHSIEAAWISTICASLLAVEKTLALREKWRLHAAIRAEFEVLKLELCCNQGTPEQITARMASLLRGYAAKLPVTPREQEHHAEERADV